MLRNNLMSLKDEAASHFFISVCWGLWFCFLRLCFELWVLARHVLPMTEKTSRLLELKSVAGLVSTRFHTALFLGSPLVSLVAKAATSAKSVTRGGRNGVLFWQQGCHCFRCGDIRLECWHINLVQEGRRGKNANASNIWKHLHLLHRWR